MVLYLQNVVGEMLHLKTITQQYINKPFLIRELSAKAGIQFFLNIFWMPACAGMTGFEQLKRVFQQPD